MNDLRESEYRNNIDLENWRNVTVFGRVHQL